MYDVPAEIEVTADGPVRVVRLNRGDVLNAVNPALHEGLGDLFPQITDDAEARAVVLTGSGRAFSAGGDVEYLERQIADTELRRSTTASARRIVMGMIQCRVPIVAAVNGPAVGLGCSLAAMSDIVYIARSAYFADPHVLVGLVAADGGALSWPFHTSLLLAKEFAFTGERISAERAVAIGLANHMSEDDKVVSEALACAHRISTLAPQAVEATKRALNIPIEQALVASIDFALASEYQSFDNAEVRASMERMRGRTR